MLVLSRKCAESICIGSEVKITVVKIDRTHVRLGIEAPARITVLREELVQSGRANRQAGAGAMAAQAEGSGSTAL
jgi:carbon storage regulator